MAATQTRQVTAESVRKFAGMTGDRNPQAATGTIKAWRDTRSMGSMEFTVQNQDGETVLQGEATVYRAVPDVRGGSGKLNSGDKWILCSNRA